MKNKLFAQISVALSGAAVIAAGTAMPVSADPVSVTKFAELVGLGSDTTMDVMDGISLALGDVQDGSGRLKLASYKAIGSADVVVSPDGIAIPRANGSGAGRDALRIAVGQVNSASVAIAPNELGAPRTASSPTTAQLAGKFHYARSSSGPSNAISAGVLTYVPFAQDNMTYATSPNSKIPSNIPLGTVANTSEVSLLNIYKGNITQVIVTADANETFISLRAPSYVPQVGERSVPLKAYIPQAGSGTRQFWLQTMVITEAQINAGSTAAKDITPGGIAVQEHDGTAVGNDPYAMVGFSISQWVAQSNRVAPMRTAGAVLRSMGGLEATVLTNGVYATAPTWTAIRRPVYNIVPTALITATEENAITRAFRGTNSLVCQAKDVIQRFGYGLLSYEGANAAQGLTPAGNATVCGNITDPNRTFAASTSSVLLDAPVVSADGTSAVVKATVASNGNFGGTVTLWSNYGTDTEEVVASGVVARNSTSVDITVNNASAAAFSKTVTAEFLPTLSGVNLSSSPTPVTVNLTGVKTVTGVSFGAATVASNGLTANFTATITGGQNGTLNVYNTNFTGTPLRAVAVTGGTASVTVDQANSEAVVYNLVGEFVPSDLAAAVSSRTTGTLAVTLRNSTTTVVTIPSSVKRTAVPTVTVNIKAGKATSTVGATGTVFGVVYNSKNVPVATTSSLVTLSSGSATLRFAKIATTGRYTVKVFYGGSANSPSSVTTRTFTVVR